MFQSISRKAFTLFLLLCGIGMSVGISADSQVYAADTLLKAPARPPQTTPKKVTVPKETLQKVNAVKSSAPIPDFSFSTTGNIDFTDFAGTLDSLSSSTPLLETAPLPPLRTRIQGHASVDPDDTVPQPRLENVLSEGIQFEEQQRWSDAMLVYEKGLKNFPTNPQILKRFRLCRYHFELGRRYHDASFEQLAQNKLTEVLRVYTDVFIRIHSNHIDSPDWKTLFGYGLDNLEVALNDQEFLKWNNITASPEKRQTLCRKIRETAAPWAFTEIQHMRNGVLNIAELVQNEIGLRPSVVLLEFICGAAYGLDPHTLFMTLRQLNDFYSTIEGSFVGIGIELDTSDPKSDVLTIAKVHPNSPAMQAGLQDGDCIISVNGTSTTGLGIERAADLLQGEANTAVVIRTKTPAGKLREIRIIRREIDVASVEDVHLIDGKIGYIRLNGFQASTTTEMVSALETLKRQGMKSLILDLRGNPGGLLPVAVEVADLFLDRGIIVRTLNRSNHSETVLRASGLEASTVPLYVLVDEESASASELFAEAIQEHKRGVLIGRPTYGKGTVQVIYTLFGTDPNKPVSGLKLTVERFYSPNGLSCCNVGIRPDVVIPNELEQTVVTSKPDLATGTIAQVAPKRKLRITSSPSDPCVAEAIAIFHSAL